MSGSRLRIEDLWAGYGSGSVLQGVTMTMDDGDIVGVIGRNGMGKTTLLKALVGLLPARGRIAYGGIDLGPLPAHRRARLGIGYVPQGRRLFPQMSVEDNFLSGWRIGSSRAGRRDLRAVLEDLFPILRERRLQLAGTMSGGEQQQVAIARALLGNPRLLLLDEPAEGIQPSIVRAMGLALAEFNSRFGTTILLIEQNVDLVAATVRTCHVLEKGAVAHTLAAPAQIDPATLARHLELR